MKLVVWIVLVGIIGVGVAHHCPLYTGSNEFVDDPAPVSKTTCPLYQESSCCTDTYLDKVEAKTDGIWTEMLRYLRTSSLSSTCITRLNEIACAPCSPTSSQFVFSHSYGNDFVQCKSFCTELHSACSSAELSSGQSAGSMDAEAFCVGLLSMSSEWRTYVNDGTHTARSNCFADTNLCTEDDIDAHYSACESSGTKEVYYSYRPDSTCLGGTPLPEAIKGLPCDLNCEPGNYLPLGSRDCQPCPAGQFSVGGGFRVSVWKDWPASIPFTTYCVSLSRFATTYNHGSPLNSPGCQWHLDDTVVMSGNITHSQASILELRVFLVRDGLVKFGYEVDAEPFFDGLAFYVDDVEELNVVKNVETFKEFEVALSAGVHVLQWSYFKDWSITQGADQAVMDFIEIQGTKFVDEECADCAPGYYSTGGASQCTECPLNHISGHGADECIGCPDNEFAFPGSHSCEPREDCTTEDKDALWTACSSAGGSPTRDLIDQWLEPKICLETASSAHLEPPLRDQPCAPCNPGHYRDGADCIICQPGAYSADLGAEACEPCPPGTQALKSLYLTRFDVMEELPGFSTFCDGDCAVDGWRLLGNAMDSGEGNGVPSEVVLQMNAEFERPGTVTFEYEFMCHTLCQFRFIDVDVVGGSFPFVGGRSTSGARTFQYHVEEAGEHTFQFVFVKYDPSDLARADRVILTEVIMEGVVDGGAFECTECEAGTFSPGNSETCDTCPAGTFSNSRASQCRTCPDGSFSQEAGSTECVSCGNGATHNSDHTDCDLNGCEWEAAPGVVYNLSELEHTDNMYGPIYDMQDHVYFLNVCSKHHSNHSCYDRSGEAIVSYSCQITNQGYGKNLGDVMGFGVMDSDIHNGLVVTYTHGDEACGSSHGGTPVPRETTVRFMCDPLAGVGYPVGLEPVEDSPCHYRFLWHSLYACPKCTRDNYYRLVTECVDGEQNEQWLPLQTPLPCHGDVPDLPPSQTRPCVANQIPCDVGEYLSTSSEGVPECAPVPPGTFSIGGGKVYDPTDAAFVGDWLANDIYLYSGEGDTTTELRIDVVADSGSVSFQYKVYATGEEQVSDGFKFWVDGRVVIGPTQSTDFSYVNVFPIELSRGIHILRWSFDGGVKPTSTARLKGALVRDVEVRGTSLAALSPTPCPTGHYSDVSGSEQCKVCPANTYARAGSVACTPCSDDDQYSLPESATCSVRPDCMEDDYSVSYGACNGGSRTATWVKLLPDICRVDPGGYQPPQSHSVSCADCPPGQLKFGDGCVSCSNGDYYVQEEMECRPVPAGTIAVPVKTYFIDDSITSLPEEFTTGCSPEGVCGSPGWRPRGGDGIDSGFHHLGEVDSWLELHTTLVSDGYISFVYSVLGENIFNGLEFYINDILQQQIQYHPTSSQRDEGIVAQVKLTAGAHTIRWVFHQEEGTESARVEMSAIEVVGDLKGSAVNPTPCAAGTYQSAEGQTKCNACPVGHYAPVESRRCTRCPDGSVAEMEGSDSCDACLDGTTPNDEHSRCEPLDGCSHFTWDGVRSFDLSRYNTPFQVFMPNRDHTLQLCDWIWPNSTCKDMVTNETLSTHSCAIDLNTGHAVDFGHRMQVSPLEASTEAPSGVRLLYKNGDICRGQTPWSTQVDILCHDENEDGSIAYTAAMVDCTLTLTYHLLGGCATCKPSDYEEVKSDCDDGTRSVKLVRKRLCNGPKVKIETHEDCDVEWEFPPWVLILILLVGVFLVAVLIFIFWRHRGLSAQYELLINDERFTERSSDPNSGPGGGTELEIRDDVDDQEEEEETP